MEREEQSKRSVARSVAEARREVIWESFDTMERRKVIWESSNMVERRVVDC